MGLPRRDEQRENVGLVVADPDRGFDVDLDAVGSGVEDRDPDERRISPVGHQFGDTGCFAVGDVVDADAVAGFCR